MVNKAYLGNDDYIFVSYSHQDRDIVYPFIEELQKKYNVWYDEGIKYGREWDDEIVHKILNCYIFIFFVTEKSLSSVNCRDEIQYAKDKGINFLNVIYNKKIKLTERFKFRYGSYQSCFLDQFDSNKSAVEDLSRKCEWFEKVRIRNKANIIDEDITTEKPKIVTGTTIFPITKEEKVKYSLIKRWACATQVYVSINRIKNIFVPDGSVVEANLYFDMLVDEGIVVDKGSSLGYEVVNHTKDRKQIRNDWLHGTNTVDEDLYSIIVDWIKLVHPKVSLKSIRKWFCFGLDSIANSYYSKLKEDKII